MPSVLEHCRDEARFRHLVIKVLVAFGEQQIVRSRLKHLDDVVTELQCINKIGLGAAPIGFVNQFLEGKTGFFAVAREAIVDTEGGLGEICIKLGPGHYRQQGKDEKETFFHNAMLFV